MRKLRNKHGLSQLALAEAADLSATFIGEIEAGRRSPSLDSLVNIAAALGVQPFQLLIPDEYQGDKLIESYNEIILSKIATILDQTMKEI